MVNTDQVYYLCLLSLGPNAGEMMMSVFWYYRPEQTEVGRLPHVHGDVSSFEF